MIITERREGEKERDGGRRWKDGAFSFHYFFSSTRSYDTGKIYRVWVCLIFPSFGYSRRDNEIIIITRIIDSRNLPKKKKKKRKKLFLFLFTSLSFESYLSSCL